MFLWWLNFTPHFFCTGNILTEIKNWSTMRKKSNTWLFRDKIRPVLLKFNIITEKTEEWVVNCFLKKKVKVGKYQNMRMKVKFKIWTFISLEKMRMAEWGATSSLLAAPLYFSPYFSGISFSQVFFSQEVKDNAGHHGQIQFDKFIPIHHFSCGAFLFTLWEDWYRPPFSLKSHLETIN